jgi:hypothetical protein
MIQVWSCGGGTQSAAIAALIIQGRIERPAYSVMVDTEREKSSTWEFVNGVLKPRLAEVGCDLVIVPKSRYATVDLYSGNGDLLLPIYSTQSGELSKLPGYCSNEWKARIAARWLRAQYVETAQTITWLGFSTDETRRVRAGRYRYPLLFDVPMSRDGCKALVRDVFGVDPPRSACWMCPHMSDREWADIRDNHPQDFAKACALDAEIRERDPHAFLHRSGQPLIQIADQIGATDQMELLGCDSGMCMI